MVASSNGNKPSLYESLRHTNATALLENLQSQLKQKEGEIVQLQVSCFDVLDFHVLVPCSSSTFFAEPESMSKTESSLLFVERYH